MAAGRAFGVAPVLRPASTASPISSFGSSCAASDSRGRVIEHQRAAREPDLLLQAADEVGHHQRVHAELVEVAIERHAVGAVEPHRVGHFALHQRGERRLARAGASTPRRRVHPRRSRRHRGGRRRRGRSGRAREQRARPARFVGRAGRGPSRCRRPSPAAGRCAIALVERRRAPRRARARELPMRSNAARCSAGRHAAAAPRSPVDRRGGQAETAPLGGQARRGTRWRRRSGRVPARPASRPSTRSRRTDRGRGPACARAAARRPPPWRRHASVKLSARSVVERQRRRPRRPRARCRAGGGRPPCAAASMASTPSAVETSAATTSTRAPCASSAAIPPAAAPRPPRRLGEHEWRAPRATSHPATCRPSAPSAAGHEVSAVGREHGRGVPRARARRVKPRHETGGRPGTPPDRRPVGARSSSASIRRERRDASARIEIDQAAPQRGMLERHRAAQGPTPAPARAHRRRAAARGTPLRASTTQTDGCDDAGRRRSDAHAGHGTAVASQALEGRSRR